jgi:hypothetical protein
VVVTQGDQQDIGVQLKSSNGISAKVDSFIPSQNYSAIKVLFNPDKLNASSFGIAPAHLRIGVPGNAQIGQYVVPILVNMSTGSILTSKVTQLANSKVSIPAQGYITTKANLTISVVEHLVSING